MREKAAPRACPVEATGMPKGTTHVTPPKHEKPMMVPCAAYPLIERLPVFRQDTLELYHIPLEHTSRNC